MVLEKYWKLETIDAMMFMKDFSGMENIMEKELHTVMEIYTGDIFMIDI